MPDKDNFRKLPGCPENLRASFWRSRNLHEIDPLFAKKIKENGIKSVLDLRGDKERAEKNDDILFLKENGVRYDVAPIFDILHYGDTTLLKGKLSNDYIDILANHKEELLVVFKKLSQLEKPVLFHCNAGKDRTGIVAMLLLGLNEIDSKTILEDYEKTEENLPLMKERGYVSYAGKRPDFVCHARKETMEETLAFLLSRYSFPDYLLSLGLAQEELSLLKLSF